MKYQHTFCSQNDSTQNFTLTFHVNAAKRIHVVTDVEVYQHTGGLLCEVGVHTVDSHAHLTVRSICNSWKFHIDIYINSTGCEIFVIETVVTTISHEPNLQPCNTTDIA